jgi:ribulose-5-phosphate 4-epimerase/fuculose-1-phosphate aldolase
MGSVGELTASALERAARVDLAAAFRLAVRLDLHEGVCNHFSVMLPDGRTLLLNRYGLHWSEVSASNLLALDAAGRVLGGEGDYEKTAFWIHSRDNSDRGSIVALTVTPRSFFNMSAQTSARELVA